MEKLRTENMGETNRRPANEPRKTEDLNAQKDSEGSGNTWETKLIQMDVTPQGN